MTMVMPLPGPEQVQTVSKAASKARALEYFRRVQQTGQPIVITDNGVPVLKLTPFVADPTAVLQDLRGSVLEYQDPLAPVGGDDWDLVP
jgi:prevent-host-death family protein